VSDIEDAEPKPGCCRLPGVLTESIPAVGPRFRERVSREGWNSIDVIMPLSLQDMNKAEFRATPSIKIVRIV
jgi:hypothetical protein